jgi:hypothetical protein
VASTSKAPDITERTIIDLSGRISTYYDLTGNAFDVAVAGMPFIMAITDSTPYKRQTAEFRAQRVDQMRDPGEHTLAGSGYWTRSQSSWHYGEGINFTEPMEGNDSEVRFRYKSSYGIDPWTPGEIKLLKKTTLAQAFTGKCKIDTGASSAGVAFLVATDMSVRTTQTTAMYKITDSGVSTALVNWSSFSNETILATTSDGTYMYVATTAGMYDVKLSDGTTHKSYTYNSLTLEHATLKYVKSRIVAGLKFTNGTYAAYELLFPDKGSGAPTDIKSTMTSSHGTLISGSTNMPVLWTWTAVAESANAIYLSGYAGEHSTLFKLGVDNTGALGTIITTAVLPRGEIALSLYAYLGTYIMIGTNKGARIATADNNGDLSYGPLVFHNENGVYDFEGRDSYIYCGNTAGVNTNSGVMAINLAQPITLSGYAQPISTGVYARATGVFADGITGTVNAVRILAASNLKAIAITGSGVWLEHATDLVPQGELVGGRIRYDTMENKAWKRIRIRSSADTTNGDIIISKVGATTDEVITTLLEGSSTTADIDLATTYPEVSPDASFKLTFYRNTTDATTGPVVVGIAVKALPTPTRARILQLPLFLYDKETDKNGNIVGYEGYARERLNALESVESLGETIVIQDFNAGGEPFEVVLEQITFTRSTPAARNYTGFGGIVQVIARTVV